MPLKIATKNTKNRPKIRQKRQKWSFLGFGDIACFVTVWEWRFGFGHVIFIDCNHAFFWNFLHALAKIQKCRFLISLLNKIWTPKFFILNFTEIFKFVRLFWSSAALKKGGLVVKWDFTAIADAKSGWNARFFKQGPNGKTAQTSKQGQSPSAKWQNCLPRGNLTALKGNQRSQQTKMACGRPQAEARSKCPKRWKLERKRQSGRTTKQERQRRLQRRQGNWARVSTRRRQGQTQGKEGQTATQRPYRHGTKANDRQSGSCNWGEEANGKRQWSIGEQADRQEPNGRG